MRAEDGAHVIAGLCRAYGQGMTTASLHALALQKQLQVGQSCFAGSADATDPLHERTPPGTGLCSQHQGVACACLCSAC